MEAREFLINAAHGVTRAHMAEHGLIQPLVMFLLFFQFHVAVVHLLGGHFKILWLGENESDRWRCCGLKRRCLRTVILYGEDLWQSYN